MSWTRTYKYKGIEFVITSGWYTRSGIYVCLALEDEESIKAIQAIPDLIIEGLKRFADDADELHIVGWADDGGFYHWPREDTLDEYERKLDIILNSEYAEDNLKNQAMEEIEQIEEQRKKILQKQAKNKIVRRRRSAFAQKHDELILALIERDGYECANCEKIEGLSIDHIIPLSKGGSDELDNLQLLCTGCNSSKGDNMPEA